MFHTVVSVLFWALFPIGCVVTLLCLIGVVWKNVQFTAARWHIDDGQEEGIGYEVYSLYLVSERLSRYAHAAMALLIAAGFAGAVGPAWLKIAALAASVVLALVADRLRGRHAGLETGFERRFGEPLAAFYRRVHGDATPA